MDEAAYQNLQKLSDRALYDFVTETDASQRKWVAIHLLEERRNKRLTGAAKASAIAAWVAAVIAGVSLAIAMKPQLLRSDRTAPVAVYDIRDRTMRLPANEICIDGVVFMRVADRFLSRADDGTPIAPPCTFITPE